MTDDKPTYRDLEQRISALEQELHDKNERLSLLMSNFDEIQELAKTGHWKLDLIQNKLHWSDEIYRIFECLPHEFEATYEAFLSFIHPEDRGYVNSSYQNHLISKAPYNIIHRILLKDGSVKFVNERCKSDFDNDGNPIRSLGTVVDITDRIQTEKKLELAHEKAQERERNLRDVTSNFETFFNSIDDFLFVIDEQGNIIHSNKTVEKRLGYTTEDLKGKSILFVHPKERKDETAKVAADVITGKLASFQMPLVSKEGKQIYVETHANAGSWNGKPAFFGVSKDITRLKLSEEKFSLVFYLNPSACSLTEANTGVFVEVNDAFCKLFGYSREETVGKNAIDLRIITKENRGQVLSKADPLGRMFNVETKLTTKSGDVKSVLISGQNIAVQDVTYRFTAIHDVTEIYKAKEIAEENEQKFSIAFHSSPDVSMITNIDTGEIIEANDAVEQVAGFSRAETIGNSVFNLNLWMFKDARDKFIDILIRNKRVMDFESVFRKKSGEAFTGLISGQMIRIKNQNCLLSIIHDITDRKNAEIELLKAKEKVEESESKFKNLYESLSIAYLILKDGACIECNEATLSIYRVESKNEIIGKSPVDFSPEFQLNHLKSSEEAAQHVRLAIEKGFHTFEWMATRKDKEEFYAEVSLKPYYYQNELYIQCLTTDITERKKAEADLIAAKEHSAENELFLRTLINTLPDLVWLKDINGVYLTCNKRLEDFIGKTEQEIIGKTDYDFLSTDIANSFRKADHEAIEAGKSIVKEELITFVSDQHAEYLETIKTPFYRRGELVGVLGIGRNITERKNAEIELLKAKERVEESEEKFKNLYETLSIAYLILKDGVCIECNKAALDIYGIESKDEFIGKSPIDFSPEYQPNKVKSLDEAIRQTQIAFEKGVHSFEWMAMRKNKELFYNEVSLKTFYYKNELYLQCLTTDISERKRIEKQLITAKNKAEESEQKFSSAFHNNPNIISITSVNDGRIIETNEASLRITGYKPEELIGKNPIELELWANNDDRNEYRDLLSKTKRVLNFETTFKKKSGETFIGLISGEIIQLNNQNYVLSIINDITELKNAELELIKAKEKAEESDRLKTAFLHNMSHEIRTPLNAISGFSSLLTEPDLTEEDINRFVQIIQINTGQLVSIVNDILTISSLETKQVTPSMSAVCINELTDELLAVFRQQASKRNISLYAKQQLDDKQSVIETDKTKITQILSNLISNALKFTHEGFIEFGYSLKGNKLEFYVKDSGIGIKQEFHDKIFERFRQGDKSINKLYGGTGLGLAISKAFVELLGGKIWVQSEFGKGSTFYFTLPYKPANKTIG